MEKKSCFIIMPFTSVKTNNQTLNESELTFIYENVIKKAIEEFRVNNKKLFSNVSRFNSKIGSIISGIAANLNQSDLVIADLTGLNPNVMYELGVRHTLRRGTIVISQDISTLPSDLRDYLCIQYNFSNDTILQHENYNRFKIELHKSIKEVFSTDKYDSPVLNYLKGKERYWKENEIQRLKENVVIFNYINEQYETIKEFIREENEKSDFTALTIILNSIIGNLSNAINDINISVQSSILYEDILAAKSLITDILKALAFKDYFENNIPQFIDSTQNPFTSGKLITELKFIDYFKINDGVFLETTLKEVFSDEHSFYTDFLLELEDYLDEKAKDLGFTEEEIESFYNL